MWGRRFRLPNGVPAPRAGYHAGMKALVGIAIVAALALAGALDYSQFLAEYSRSGDPMQMAAQQARLRGASAALPAGATVGYLSDMPTSDVQGQAMFGAAQYALAPRLLVPLKPGARPEWVVGYFAGTIGAHPGLAVISDYGNGVVLFRRAQ